MTYEQALRAMNLSIADNDKSIVCLYTEINRRNNEIDVMKSSIRDLEGYSKEMNDFKDEMRRRRR